MALRRTASSFTLICFDQTVTNQITDQVLHSYSLICVLVTQEVPHSPIYNLNDRFTYIPGIIYTLGFNIYVTSRVTKT